MFDRLIHSDWSVDARKRWMASAVNLDGIWHVSAPLPVGSIQGFIKSSFDFASSERVLLGFDFPIGLPEAYGAATGLEDFRQTLRLVGGADWAEFFTVATVPEEISLRRPFYPNVSSKGVSRRHLFEALGLTSFQDILRICERKTPDRQAACSLFWTLGGNQVGKAAISGWIEVIRPAMLQGARLWPFDGKLNELSQQSGVTLAETYPAEAYRMFGANFAQNQSKRVQLDRASKATAIHKWAADEEIELALELVAMIGDGFGSSSNGEDAFDAFAGLVKMIEVADGRRPQSYSRLAGFLKMGRLDSRSITHR